MHYLAGSSLHHFVKTIFSFQKKLKPFAILRLVPAFLVVFITTPVRLLEYALFNHKIRDQSITDIIFVVGHARSGTTFLQYLLSLDHRYTFPSQAQCMAPHTLILSGSLTRWVMKLFLPKKRYMDNLNISADTPGEEEFALGNMGGESMVWGYYFPEMLQKVFDEYVLFNNKTCKQRWQRNLLYFAKKNSLCQQK